MKNKLTDADKEPCLYKKGNKCLTYIPDVEILCIMNEGEHCKLDEVNHDKNTTE